MNHTSDVFKQNYQADHVRVNALEVRFRKFIRDNDRNQALQNAVRAMSFKRDQGAPIDVTPEDLKRFE